MIAGTELGCVDELFDDNLHGNKMYQSQRGSVLGVRRLSGGAPRVGARPLALPSGESGCTPRPSVQNPSGGRARAVLSGRDTASPRYTGDHWALADCQRGISTWRGWVQLPPTPHP